MQLRLFEIHLGGAGLCQRMIFLECTTSNGCNYQSSNLTLVRIKLAVPRGLVLRSGNEREQRHRSRPRRDRTKMVMSGRCNTNGAGIRTAEASGDAARGNKLMSTLLHGEFVISCVSAPLPNMADATR